MPIIDKAAAAKLSGKASVGGLYAKPANPYAGRWPRNFNPFRRQSLSRMIKGITITDEPFLPPRERKPR
jgi:hypothetical protein